MDASSANHKSSLAQFSPNRHFFYVNSGYENVFKQLSEGFRERKGLFLVVGPQGTGKTKLIRLLSNTVDDSLSLLFFPAPPLTFEELLTEVCRYFLIQESGSTTTSQFEALLDYLRATTSPYESVILIIDNAHTASPEMLAQLLPLLDLTGPFGALLQIVLTGRPELETLLTHPDLLLLQERVAVRCYVSPLQQEEVGQFIRQQYSFPSQLRQELFTEETIERIAHYSQAIPARIIQLCENALRVAYAQGKRTISSQMIEDLGSHLSPIVEPVPTSPPNKDPEPALPGIYNSLSLTPRPSWPDIRAVRRQTIRLGQGLVLIGLCAILLLAGISVGQAISSERVATSVFHGTEKVGIVISGIKDKITEIITPWLPKHWTTQPDSQATAKTSR